MIPRRAYVLITALSGSFLLAQAPASAGKTRDVQQGRRMTTIKLGEDSKMTALPAERERLQKFYAEVLGCKVTTKSDTFDLIQLGPDFFIGITYDPSALKNSDAQKALWLELRTDDPAGLKQKILAFGLKQLEFWDKEHFYFQAPGGQVFRLVGMTEDMSKWQR